MNPNSLKIYKVKRFDQGYPYTDPNAKPRLKDQNIYETPGHVVNRISDYRYFKYEVFAAKPFINSNDELELRWELLTPNQIEELREAVRAERLDKRTKRR